MKKNRFSKYRTILLQIVLCCILFGFIVYCSVLGYVLVTGEKDTFKNTSADVAIILGSSPYKDGDYHPCMVARIEHGVELFKQGKVKAIIVSGGSAREGNGTEAQVMQQIAVQKGMDERYLFKEGESTSTYENILFSKKGLDYYQAHSTVIVTVPYNNPRAELVGKRLLSQKIYVSPAVKSECWQQKFFYPAFYREPFAFIFYFLTGKI